MKSNLWKRMTVLGLAGVLAVGIVGCGGSSDSGSSNNSSTNDESTGSEDTGSAEGGSESSDSGEKPVISFMNISYYGTDLANENSDIVIAAYEEYTGISVDWQWEANDTYNEKIGLTLMDKDNMPMIIANGGDLGANFVDAAKKGAFWDLTEYLQDSERFPNLSQYNENVMSALTIDGQVIGIYRAREVGRNGLSYRTDWAEAVGITEAPQTIDDVYDMLYKFTYEDPDGNGVDDTYGLEMTKYTGPFDVIQTWFGAGNGWAEQDGQLVPVHQTDEYREAISWMRKLYEDGLIRQDWATVDSGTFGDATKKGETGVFIDVMDGGRRVWDYFVDNEVESVVDASEIAEMNLLGPVNEKTLATSGFNGFYVITKDGAKTEEDLINCLTFLDKMCDNEMMVLADYGLEDINWDYNDDGQVVVREGEMELQEAPQHGLNQAIAYIPHLAATEPERWYNERRIAQDESYEVNREYAVYNPALGYLANSETNAEVGTDIAQIIDDARTQYICGQIDDAGFDAAAEQWMNRGGDRLIEEINELYQADK